MVHWLEGFLDRYSNWMDAAFRWVVCPVAGAVLVAWWLVRGK